MMANTSTQAPGKFRTLLTYLVRRLGLLPGGTPDRLGQDGSLRGVRLPHEVMVYFADTVGSLYQIEQWYESFRALDSRHRLVVVMADSRAARRVRAESGLDVIVVGEASTLADLIDGSDMKVALYVNHNPENFGNLRFSSMVHASLMHGDSDKGVTVSNQTKAYDFSLVAGQAAIDRMAAFSTFYDASTRCIPIGRPQRGDMDQAGSAVAEATARASGSGRTVLYAPTWEGPQPSAAYGSIETHGTSIVRSFLDAGWRVIYRPHPLSGIRSPEYGEADDHIRQMLSEAEARLHRGHRVDTEQDISRAFLEASVMVCDVSGVAMDWLPTTKPLIVTVPASQEVSVAKSPLTALVPALLAADATSVAVLAEEQVTLDPLLADRNALVEYYLGDQTPGASLGRFVEAVERLIGLRTTELDH